MENGIKEWLNYTRRKHEIEKAIEAAINSVSDLSLNAFYFLLHLDEAADNELNLTLLEQKIGISQSAMSRLVSRMEDRHCGVIERKSHPNDKRSITIKLTKSGKETLDTVRKIVTSVLTEYDF